MNNNMTFCWSWEQTKENKSKLIKRECVTLDLKNYHCSSYFKMRIICSNIMNVTYYLNSCFSKERHVTGARWFLQTGTLHNSFDANNFLVLKLLHWLDVVVPSWCFRNSWNCIIHFHFSLQKENKQNIRKLDKSPYCTRKRACILFMYTRTITYQNKYIF